MGAQEENIRERIVSRKQLNKRLAGDLARAVTEELPIDIWLVLACLSLEQVVPKAPHTAWLFAFLLAARVYRKAAVFAGVCARVSAPYVQAMCCSSS